jgi:hypothetical protein
LPRQMADNSPGTKGLADNKNNFWKFIFFCENG